MNAERAPAYFRLDLRAQRIFNLSRPLVVFFGVQNVTNRKNFSAYTWNRRINTVRFQEQQGLFPILGLEWKF